MGFCWFFSVVKGISTETKRGGSGRFWENLKVFHVVFFRFKPLSHRSVSVVKPVSIDDKLIGTWNNYSKLRKTNSNYEKVNFAFALS